MATNGTPAGGSESRAQYTARDRSTLQRKFLAGEEVPYLGIDGQRYFARYHQHDRSGVNYMSIRPEGAGRVREPTMTREGLDSFIHSLTNPQENQIARSRQAEAARAVSEANARRPAHQQQTVRIGNLSIN